MTSPTPQTLWDNFNNSLAQLEADSKISNTDQGDENKIYHLYYDEKIKKLDSMTDPDEMLYYIITQIFDSDSPDTAKDKNATILGIANGQLGVKGDALVVNNDLAQVNNNLQKMIDTDESTYSAGAGKTNGGNPLIYDTGYGIDKLLHDFSTNSDVQAAIDPQVLQNLQETYTSFRQQYYLDPNAPIADKDPYLNLYNPAENTDPKDNGYTYHFYGFYSDTISGYNNQNPDEKGNLDTYLSTYDEMRTDMQTPGDAKEATEGYQDVINQANSVTSMVQTANTAEKVEISQVTNAIQQWEGLYQNGVLMPRSKLINQAIQNQRGSSG